MEKIAMIKGWAKRKNITEKNNHIFIHSSPSPQTTFLFFVFFSSE
jgi:hypothetical protein